MKQLAALEATIERVDGDDFASLSGRIAFQKRIYLVQVAGLHLGYRFSWNQYGPYSPELAQDRIRLESARDDIRELVKKLQIKDDVASTLGKVKAFIQTPNETGLTDVEWLELMSSLHYLAQESGGLPPQGDRGALEQDLISRKPHLEVKALGQAWERLESLQELASA